MEYTTEDFIDEVDKLLFVNDNEMAYYRGKADGFRTATDMAYRAEDVVALEEWLYSHRQSLIQDKEDLNYKSNWVEEERRFICGELDAVDEVRDLLLDRKGVKQ